MKRVIVTGATGFVGANLVRRLLADGHEAHLLVRPGHSKWRIQEIKPDVRLHEVELGDSETVSRTVHEIRPEWIFHLAAHGAYSSQTDLAQMVETNIAGTINLVQACLKTGFEAFVNTGSSSEYGFKDHPPSEEELVEPNSHYAVTKASATLFCRHTAQRENVYLPTLRLYSVYGPYEEPARLMPTIISKGVRNELPPLVDPDIARDFVFTEDVCDAYVLAATSKAGEPGEIYNVGSGEQTTLRDVVDVARRVLSISEKPTWGSMPNRNWDTAVWVSDNKKIRRLLGWKPMHTFEEGFKSMVDWFRENASYYEKAATE